jgi:hypothetical protein
MGFGGILWSMKWLALFATLGACATSDDRPQTLAYITETILAPRCSQAECHSSVRRQSGYVFDTVEHAQESLADPNMTGSFGQPLITPGQPLSSTLLIVLGGVEDADGKRYEDNFGNRMPLDAPLPNLDVYYIGTWIKNGAAGYVPPGP